MEKFIFYKGKYYTKHTIQTLHEMCEYSIELAEQKHELYIGVCKKFIDYLDKNKIDIRYDFLMNILICVAGIKIGTLL